MTIDVREAFVATLGFGLDAFQLEAMTAIDDGHHVLVSAPTGSGKTLVAFYGIERALAAGSRAFYTTPLKALSNQKYHELVARHGSARVGLLTGDVSLNRTADVVVMTTEVLRNMLLTDSDQVAELGLVVLDEVHYLQDPFRGGVWEEVIILTAPDVRFVALSATIANADILGEWLTSVRGPTHVVVERERPITLHHHVALRHRGEVDPEIIDLLDGSRLSDDARRVDNAMRSSRRGRLPPTLRGAPSHSLPTPFVTPRRGELLEMLDAEDLLPAIYFIFSRAACSAAVDQMTRDGLRFTSATQRPLIRQIARRRTSTFTDEELRALEFDPFVDSLERGITCHHAGLVPAFREIVEECFEANLLGVVFATETLALGINMPARSVVIERFAKYSDAGRSTLTSGDFAQLTGRAGRRGLDEEGHAIVSFAPETTMVDVGRVAVSDPPNLHSSFRPTYNLTANLMAHFTEAVAGRVLERSFAQFESDRRLRGGRRSLMDHLDARRAVLEELGFARGWGLTSAGQSLRSIYHECDLLIAESWRDGLFDAIEPAVLAAVLSVFVHEPRRSRRTGPHRQTPSRKHRARHDRLGDQRRDDIAGRVQRIALLDSRQRDCEDQHQLHHAKSPDDGFASTIAAWVRGAPLLTVLELVGTDGVPLSPGDFVRTAKQVADLCEQVGRLGTGTPLAATAQATREAVVRSVVAGPVAVPRGEGADS